MKRYSKFKFGYLFFVACCFAVLEVNRLIDPNYYSVSLSILRLLLLLCGWLNLGLMFSFVFGEGWSAARNRKLKRAIFCFLLPALFLQLPDGYFFTFMHEEHQTYLVILTTPMVFFGMLFAFPASLLMNYLGFDMGSVVVRTVAPLIWSFIVFGFFWSVARYRERRAGTES